MHYARIGGVSISRTVRDMMIIARKEKNAVGDWNASCLGPSRGCLFLPLHHVEENSSNQSTTVIAGSRVGLTHLIHCILGQ